MSLKSPSGGRLTSGDFVIDTQAAQLLRQDRAIELTPKSFEVLCLLAENAERVLARDELAAAWRGRSCGHRRVHRPVHPRHPPGLVRHRPAPAADRAPARLCTEGTGASGAGRRSPGGGARGAGGDRPVIHPSIVVLPFANISEGARLDMLARGFSEDITAGLAHYAQLFVIGRESAVAFGEGARDARAIGHAAGVRFVVQGSLR